MSALFRMSSVAFLALCAFLAAGTGLFFLWWSGVVLGKLFAEYQDNSPATYLLIGLFLLGFAPITFVAAPVLTAVAVRLSLGSRRLR